MSAKVQVPVALLDQVNGCSIFTAKLSPDARISRLTELLITSLAQQQIELTGQLKYQGQILADQAQSILGCTAGTAAGQPLFSVAVVERITVQLQLAGTSRTISVSVRQSDRAHQLYAHAREAFG